MLAEECEKALASTGLPEVAAPPGRASNASGLVKSVAGAVTAATRAASSGGARQRRGGGQRRRRNEQGERQPHVPYWNTASGLSRLSDPSKAIASSSSAETARSIDRVCATSASMAPITSASPAALPVASIWS